MDKWVQRLREVGVSEVRCDEPMSLHTTWKIGGPADLFISITDRFQLQKVITVLREAGVPWRVIGRGSNTLVLDGGIRGAVLKLDGQFASLDFVEERVTAGAGYSFIKLSVLAAKQGLTGLEFAGGIPGSVGGAVYMNAGAHGSDISRVLVSAEILLADGTIRSVDREWLQFAYRHSRLQEEQAIVLSATFELSLGDRRVIAAAMAGNKERRQRTQPWNQPCAGSVFRNPPGDHAARLIEQAGLKGTSVGGAQISPVHANFIVNTGQSKATDVLELIEKVKLNVEQQYQMRLVTEVLVMGDVGHSEG